MKKLSTLLFMFFSITVFADSPISIYEIPTAGSHIPWVDDTGTLQALLTAGAGGTVTLPSGHGNYRTSSVLTIPANTVFQLSGNFIIPSQASGATIHMDAGSTMTGGTLEGPWVITTPGDAGSSGIGMYGDNCTVSNMTIESFSTYGVFLTSHFQNSTVTTSTLTKIGYIAFYYDPEVNGMVGGIFTHNVVDNSMLNATNIPQDAVAIRASTNVLADSAANWTISYNVISMPLNPSHVAAECMEVRALTNSTVSHNTFNQGTIGISVARCRGVTVSFNHTNNSGHEGIEFADCHDCYGYYNNVNGSFDTGILIDGVYDKSRRITLTSDTVSGCTNSAIHCFTGTHNFTFNSLLITTATIGVYMQGADTLTTNSCNINGGGTSGTIGYYFALANGNTAINSGSILNCTFAVKAYSNVSAFVVNNIVGINVNLAGTATQFGSSFSNGAHYGTNIHFTVSSFTFGPISAVVYGVSDFSPGATSSLPITYSSGNTAIATIISGNIHITGTGSVSITATNGDTTASQSLTVSKKALIITADDKIKITGSLNPPLTVHYSTFAYAETSAVLTTQPTVTTTAVTGSPSGSYPITPSGAAAANYTFSYIAGTLTVGGYRYGPILHFKAKHL